MNFSFKNYLLESIEGGIEPYSSQGMAVANYTVNKRTFKIMFTYNPQDQSIHINWLGGESDNSTSFSELIRKFANDVTSFFGPVNPKNITYTPSSGPLKKHKDGTAARDRLFQRYIRQITHNMPPSKNYTQNLMHYDVQPQPKMMQGKYHSHPLRKAYKGSDEEFAQLFGL